jgi:hypothetical protein
MTRITGLLLLLSFAAMPAFAESPVGDCLSAPTYDCLVAGAIAATESESDPAEQAAMFASLAGAQAAVGRRQDAAANLDRAYACAPSIDGDWQREYYAALVVWAKAGLAKFNDAEVLAAHLVTSYHSAIAYLSLAEGQALNGDKEGALQSLRMAKVAAGQSDIWSSEYVGAYLAVSFAQAGEPQEAHGLAQAVYDIDVHETGLVWTLYSHAVAAVAEAIAGHDEDSLALIAEVQKHQGELEEKGDLFAVLSSVVWAYAELGDREAMLSAMREMGAIDYSEVPTIDQVNGLSTAAMALERAAM